MGYAAREGFHGPSGSRLRYDAAVRSTDQEFRDVRKLRTLGDALDEGSRFMVAQHEGIETGTAPPDSLRVPLTYLVAPQEVYDAVQRFIVPPGMVEMTYHSTGADNLRFVYATPAIVGELRAENKRRRDNKLFASGSLHQGRFDLTSEGYDFVMQAYASHFVDMGPLGEAFILGDAVWHEDGDPFIPPHMASAQLPRATWLAANAGIEEGHFATAGKPESIDAMLLGRTGPTPSAVRKTADPVKLYPHEKLGFHF